MSFSKSDFETLLRKDFPKVSVKRTETCKKISDIAFLEFNVRDEVVFQSFIDQNKCKSEHLEKVIKRIRNLKPKCTETTNKISNQKRNMIVNHDTSLDNLIEYFLDNMKETPIKIRPPTQMEQSQTTFLPLRHKSHVNDSDIRSKAEVYLQPLKIVPTRFQVQLIPIKVQKGKPCFLVKTLQNSPSKPASAT